MMYKSFRCNPMVLKAPNVRISLFIQRPENYLGMITATEPLVAIDIAGRSINALKYPASEFLKGNIPSIFFDAFGRLFGIGSELDVLSNRSLFEFDLQTGEIIEWQELAFEGNQDGCSCPYTIHVQNQISEKQFFPCTNPTMTIRLINRSPFHQSGVTLRDTFPEDVIISQVHTELVVEEVKGQNTNILQMEGLEIPIGEDSILLQLDIPEDARRGIYYNRTYLYDVNKELSHRTDTISSDDPTTLVFGDATQFEIKQLNVDFGDDTLFLCAGESLELNPKVVGAKSYLWSTGDTTPTIYIHEEGQYGLQIETECEQKQGSVAVVLTNLTVDLGGDRQIDRGERIILAPIFSSDGQIVDYFWNSTSDDLSCTTCDQPEVIGNLAEFEIALEAKNDLGCTASDTISITTQEITISAPTAFSPNGDGINDVFFPVAPKPYPIDLLRIYNRWGGVVFEQRNITANDKTQGWHGPVSGQAPHGEVYVWEIVYRQSDFSTSTVFGEVVLLR